MRASKTILPSNLAKLQLTEKAIEEANDQEYIMPSIAKGKITTIYADPNQGKTTFAQALMTLGKTCYLDAENPMDTFDSSLIADNFIISASMGTTIKEFMNVIEWLAGIDEHLLLIIDTLIHFADPNDQQQVMEFYKSLQSVRNKGHTVIVLHHTNKKEASASLNAKQFYGNTSIQSQSDNMLYLTGIKQPDGNLIVTLDPIKKRGYLEKRSYLVHTLNNNITMIDEHDPKQRMEDEPIIALMHHVLISIKGDCTTVAIQKIMKEQHATSTRRTNEVLNRYIGKEWLKKGTGNKRQWEPIKKVDTP